MENQDGWNYLTFIILMDEDEWLNPIWEGFWEPWDRWIK